MAENIKAKRLIELTNEQFGFPSKERLSIDFISYFKDEMNKKEGNTKTAWLNTYKHLTDYQKSPITFSNVDRQWLEGFKEFLLSKVSPQSTSTYFAKIKCALNEAVKDEIIVQSPGKFVKPIKLQETIREYLNVEEIQRLMNTDFNCDDVKRAFQFSCFTGLRFGDIKSLKWSMIKETNMNGNGTSLH